MYIYDLKLRVVDWPSLEATRLEINVFLFILQYYYIMNQSIVKFSFAEFFLFVHYLRKLQGGEGKASSHLRYQKIICYT